MAKKYISKINKGGNDLFIKDSESREGITSLENLKADKSELKYGKMSVGILDAGRAIRMLPSYSYVDIKKGEIIEVDPSETGSSSTTYNFYIYYYGSRTELENIHICMGGIEVPFKAIEEHTSTVDPSIKYYSIESQNIYSGITYISLL